ncbi:MAG: ABC transporter permease, partial [Bacteroidetes bacterium]|nr:ABC transporter permease [Bacteroidota bacterium]
MNLSFQIARKYFFSKKVNSVVNIISAISLAGVAFGTAALIVILSVFNGFENLVISLYNSFDSSFKIELNDGKYFSLDSVSVDSIQFIEGVKAYTPVIEENFLI